MLGPVDLNVYIWVTNVLNTQNIIQVFNTSGDAYDDGYLTTGPGASKGEGYAAYGEDKRELYERLYLASIYDPTNFGPPRQIRLGIRVNY